MRKHIGLKTKLAAALLTILREDESGKLVPVISHDDAKKMTADQILSVFHFDHWPVAKHMDGEDVHWNLVPRPIIEHREKTATHDTPIAAKVKRVTADQEEFRAKMLAKVGIQVEVTGRKRKGPPIPGSRRSKFKRKMDGTVERR